METIEINIEKIREAYKKGNETERKVLVDLFGERVRPSVMDRIKTFRDAVREKEDLSLMNFGNKFAFLTKDEIAYIKLKVVTEALNEGWEADWENRGQRKYYIVWDMANGISCSDYTPLATEMEMNTRFYFKSSELAEYCAEQFKDLWGDYLLIPKK